MLLLLLLLLPVFPGPALAITYEDFVGSVVVRMVPSPTPSASGPSRHARSSSTVARLATRSSGYAETCVRPLPREVGGLEYSYCCCACCMLATVAGVIARDAGREGKLLYFVLTFPCVIAKVVIGVSPRRISPVLKFFASCAFCAGVRLLSVLELPPKLRV